MASLAHVIDRPVTGPLAAWRGNPLAWRPGANAQRTAMPPLLATRIQSFAYALAGVRFALRNEPNMRIHLVS